jgi:purine-binding chemotaxis protein CheW
MSSLAAMHIENLDLVVFTVDGVTCALRVDEVQEIKRVIQINDVYHAPEYVRGVINLRGQIVTVIDMRRKLNYQPCEVSESSRLVIVKREEEHIGLLVDTIEDTVVARTKDILKPPSNIQGAEVRFFLGVCKTPDSLVTILDLKAILEKDEETQDEY